ncbi:E3 ubiquitin-protein ligase ubr3 [Frankliniella fusca]|uniref:E3 ubiquitin-protein ligase ubr3 n=1 Tax=Frankliniella fusca TaxID=407009 RepID=A0AAE1HBF9_9NEOP|nr:E3 ubiquitin-protein ligase ubr3 [Frankliniella fusca]
MDAPHILQIPSSLLSVHSSLHLGSASTFGAYPLRPLLSVVCSFPIETMDSVLWCI